MSASRLHGRRVAVLATDGFEHAELTEPKRLLEEAGAKVTVVSPGEAKEIRGWKGGDWADSVAVDLPLARASADDFDALLLPGGVINPDQLRLTQAAIDFIRAFGEAGKPVAAICHGPWTLIDADLVNGRQVTSWPSLRSDLENAGALWRNAEVVTDGPLITSRKPDDIPKFAGALIDKLAA
jgi:protease I